MRLKREKRKNKPGERDRFSCDRCFRSHEDKVLRYTSFSWRYNHETGGKFNLRKPFSFSRCTWKVSRDHGFALHLLSWIRAKNSGEERRETYPATKSFPLSIVWEPTQFHITIFSILYSYKRHGVIDFSRLYNSLSVSWRTPLQQSIQLWMIKNIHIFHDFQMKLPLKWILCEYLWNMDDENNVKGKCDPMTGNDIIFVFVRYFWHFYENSEENGFQTTNLVCSWFRVETRGKKLLQFQ